MASGHLVAMDVLVLSPPRISICKRCHGEPVKEFSPAPVKTPGLPALIGRHWRSLGSSQAPGQPQPNTPAVNMPSIQEEATEEEEEQGQQHHSAHRPRQMIHQDAAQGTARPWPEAKNYNGIPKPRRGSLSTGEIRIKSREKNLFLSLLIEIKCMDYLLNGWFDLLSCIKNTPKLRHH